MMMEIVRARDTLTNYIPDKTGRTKYNFKRHAIQNCLYGVDIDPSAVEIAKLRLWLSLVVDEEDIKQIQPLPNLDYKVVCGNSLLGVERNMFNNELFRKLEELKPLYFDETHAKKKLELRKQIDQLIDKITNDKKVFDFEVYFSEAFHKEGGFDVVIANPPYGAELDKDELKLITAKVKDTRNSNSAALFIDIARNRLISKNGTLTYIVPKSLLYSEGWFSLVKSMLGSVNILVDVEKAFENVKLEQVVFVYCKHLNTTSYIGRKFLENKFVTTTEIPNNIVLRLQAWVCGVTQKELDIARKLKPKCVYMRDISETKRGIPLQKYLSPVGDYPVIGGINVDRYACTGQKGFLSKSHLGQNNKKLSFLNQPKIVSQNIVAHVSNPHPHILITSTYDSIGNVLSLDTVNNTVLTNNNYDYRYILALFNATFTSWYAYKFIFCSAIRTMHFDNHYIGKIPIPQIDFARQNAFINIVDRILATKRVNPQADTSAWEQEINQLVYELYGLTQEEIAVVEGSTRP
jgi:hypothetical protein